MKRAYIGFVFVFVLGCVEPSSQGDDSGVDDSVDVHCTIPTDQCHRLGLYFGTCGGEEPPVLACDEQGRCAWYAGGCPLGFRASSCTASDVCCHDTADGRWPFRAWAPEARRAKLDMVYEVASIGAAVVDATSPSEVEVTVDPAVVAPEAAAIRCSEDNPFGDLCNVSIFSSGLRRVDGAGSALLIRFMGNSLLDGSWISLEIVDAGDAPIARLFVRGYTDAAPSPVPSACDPFQPRFESGVLHLSALDESAHGRLRAEQPGGHWIEFDF